MLEMLAQAKALASRWHKAMGRPLGITSEVAECEAALLLNLELQIARHPGYDAVERSLGACKRIQIRGRCIDDLRRHRGRVGAIDLSQAFDSVMLVILDREYQAMAIYEATREAVTELMQRPGANARNVRGSVGISQFKAISLLRWERSDL